MEGSRIYRFGIAGHIVEIKVERTDFDLHAALPSFAPFASNDTVTAPLLSFTITNAAAPKTNYREIGDFDTGNGHTKTEKDDATGHYQFLIRDIHETPCAWMWADSHFTNCSCHVLATELKQVTFALNSALMMAMAYSSSWHHTLLIHASCPMVGDYAYAFIAKSGTGKSTQTRNWLQHVPGAELLNDDNPILRVIDGQAYIYGTPWSGKTHCYRNVRRRLGAIIRIERAPQNSIERLPAVAAFASLLPSCSTLKWEKEIYNNTIATITSIIATTGCYTLHCLPDKESALLCSTTVICK